MNPSKIGGVLGTAGIVYGLYYAMKHNKQLGTTAIYAIGFGLVGIVVGNQINKFYQQ